MSDIVSALKWRYATKKFDPDRLISEQEFAILLESCRLAPSSFGLQPWRFVVVKDPVLRQSLLSETYKQMQVVDASHLIIICRLTVCGPDEIDAYVSDTAEKRSKSIESLKGYRDMMVSVLGKQSEQEHHHWMDLQCYIALGFLMETAALLRIDSCPMEGFSKEGYDQVLGLSKRGLVASVVCPVGYRMPDDKYASITKSRFEHSDVVIEL